MSSGKVIGAYILFTLFSAVIFGWVIHSWIAAGVGAIIVILWWSIAAIFGVNILLWSMKVSPLNVARYSELARTVVNCSRDPKVGTPSLWIINNLAPMIMSVGMSPGSSHMIFTRGFLDSLDDKVHYALIVREIECIRSGLTAANTGAATLHWLILLPGKIEQLVSGREPGEPNLVSIILNLIPASVAMPFAHIMAEKKRVYVVDRDAGMKLENAEYMPYGLLKLQEKILHMPFNCELPLIGCCAMNPMSKDPYSTLFRVHPTTPRRMERLRHSASLRRK